MPGLSEPRDRAGATIQPKTPMGAAAAAQISSILLRLYCGISGIALFCTMIFSSLDCSIRSVCVRFMLACIACCVSASFVIFILHLSEQKLSAHLFSRLCGSRELKCYAEDQEPKVHILKRMDDDG